jgi:predicted AAA+ superfamily ATPase
MYIKRHIEKIIERLADNKGIIVVTGARQIGKSTMLRKEFPQNDYVLLDSPTEYTTARENPTAFLKLHTGKVIFDEIQKVPEILPFIKMNIDNEIFADIDKNTKSYTGKYLLTGSQNFI